MVISRPQLWLKTIGLHAPLYHSVTTKWLLSLVEVYSLLWLSDCSISVDLNSKIFLGEDSLYSVLDMASVSFRIWAEGGKNGNTYVGGGGA